METFINPRYIAIGARQEAQPNEILLFEAAANYTTIHFANGKKLLVAITLKTFEDRFKSHNFFRTHKGYLVNMAFANRLCEAEYKLHLNNKLAVNVSRRKLLKVRKQLFMQNYVATN